VTDEAKFKSYLQSAAGYLSQQKKAALEHIIRKYQHVFHDENNKFKGTDL
jgi:hypothetical protein